MNRFYLELGSFIRIALFDDDFLVFCEEYKYNIGILNSIASRILDSKPDSVTVIMHGLFYEKQLSDSYVAYVAPINGNRYYCNLNQEDVDSVLNILNRMNVKNVRIIDKFGYYEKLTSGDAIIVDKVSTLYLVFIKNGADRQIIYTSSSNLENALLQAMVSSGVTRILDASYEFIKKYTETVSNLSSVETADLRTVLATVSLFRYADTDEAREYELRINENKNTAAQSTVLESVDENEQKLAKDTIAEGESTDKAEFDSELVFYPPDQFDEMTEAEKSYYTNKSREADCTDAAISEESVLDKMGKQDTSTDSGQNLSGYDEEDATDSDFTEDQFDLGENLLEPEDDEWETSENLEDFDDLPEKDNGAADNLFDESHDDIGDLVYEDSNTDAGSGAVKKKKQVHAFPAVLLLTASIAATLILWVQNDLLGRDNISLSNKVADQSTAVRKVQDRVSSGGTIVPLTESDIDVYNSIRKISLDGYIGEFVISKDSYEVLIYYYKKKDRASVEKSLSAAKEILDITERGTLQVGNRVLYKYKYAIKK